MMLVEVSAGLVVATLLGVAGLGWRYRGNLSLLRVCTHPTRKVRVSFSALLRVREDDRFVLFHTPSRPGSFGPPGGVFKHAANCAALDRLEFEAEPRPAALGDDRRYDLRGFIGPWSALSFIRWFDLGDGRESGVECLRREIAEELVEVGHPEFAADVAKLGFNRVRVVNEPIHLGGHSGKHWQLRRFDVYDLDGQEAAIRFRRQLLELACDPNTPNVIAATVREVRYGRCAAGLIGSHSEFLIRNRRRRIDLPPIR